MCGCAVGVRTDVCMDVGMDSVGVGMDVGMDSVGVGMGVGMDSMDVGMGVGMDTIPGGGLWMDELSIVHGSSLM